MKRSISSVLVVLALAGCGGAFPDQDLRTPPKPPVTPRAGSTLDRFAALDRNGDGAIDRQEAAGHWSDIFRIMDAREDGHLTAAEFMALPSPRMAVRTELMEMEDPKRYGAFVRLDRNHDGAVTLDEFLGAEDQLFDILDRDHDGRLTPEELGIAVHEEPPNQGILRLPPVPPPHLPPTAVSPVPSQAVPAAQAAPKSAPPPPPPSTAAPPPPPRQLPQTHVGDTGAP